MFFHLLKALLIILALMGIWLALQLYERWQSADSRQDCDLLASRFRCWGCLLKAHCRKEEHSTNG